MIVRGTPRGSFKLETRTKNGSRGIVRGRA